ncbi:MAG: xanthine dehydrogenase [Ruminococcaceae bacterium]|nr:xanthine dehydrogenase [Oscillospiraceae bacterium]
MITIQKYIRVQSLEEAWELNQKKNNRILGGMLWLKMGRANVNTAIDLCDLGLEKIEESDDAFSIGTSVTLRQLEMHKGLNTYTCGAVREALSSIVGVQFRNMATIGGSIWGRFGFSDVLTVFLTMDCYVELYKGGIVPLPDFAVMKRDRDLLVRLIVKKTPAKFVYTSMRNQRTDFPVLACGVGYVNDEYRVSVGARPGQAMLLRDTDGILANGISLSASDAFAAFAAEAIPTGSNVRASAAYRTHLIRVLVSRALTELGGL